MGLRNPCFFETALTRAEFVRANQCSSASGHNYAKLDSPKRFWKLHELSFIIYDLAIRICLRNSVHASWTSARQLVPLCIWAQISRDTCSSDKNNKNRDLLLATPFWTDQQERLLLIWMKPGRKHVQTSLDVRGLNNWQKTWVLI